MSSNWRDQASCAGADPEAFFPFNSPEKIVLKVCEMCPVQQECLDYAIEHNIQFGIWGGKTINDRKRIERERRKKNSG